MEEKGGNGRSRRHYLFATLVQVYVQHCTSNDEVDLIVLFFPLKVPSL